MTIPKFAKQINVPASEVYRIVKRDDLTTVIHQKNITLTFDQQNYVTRVLFFERKTDFLTFESKMNDKKLLN